MTQSVEVALVSIVDKWVKRASIQHPGHPRQEYERAVLKIIETLAEEAGPGVYPALVRQIASGELDLDVFDIGSHLEEEGD